MRAQGKIPAWLQGLSGAICAQAGYYTSNNAKTDYNSPIDIKEAWNECGRTGALARTARTAGSRSSASSITRSRTKAACFPLKEQPLGFPPTDPAKVRDPALPARHAGDPRRLGALLQSHDAAGRPDRRQAQGPGGGRTGRQHDRLLLLRQRRRAAAQQTVPAGERHARAADRLFPAEVASPRARRAGLADQEPVQLRRLRADGAVAGRREDPRLHAGPRLCRAGQGASRTSSSSAPATGWTNATT